MAALGVSIRVPRFELPREIAPGLSANRKGEQLLPDRPFELSRWRGGRYRVYSLKRRWSLEELTVQRYDDVDMNGDTSST